MIDLGPFSAVVKSRRVPAPAPSSTGGGDILGILRQAGFKGEALRTAWAVAKAESGHNPRAFNPNASTGDRSYGLFQINMLGALGPERRKAYGLRSDEELYDPLTNAKIAYRMSGGGKNWQPWSAYKSGAYKANLGSFPGASELPLRSQPLPARELPLAKGTTRPFADLELDRDNPFASVVGANPFGVLANSPFANVISRTATQPGRPRGTVPLPPVLSGSWQKWVGPIQHRTGPSKPHTQEILSFVGQVGQVAGTRLTPWGNESHSLTTVNGNRSAHADGRAADIPASGAELIRLGRAALIAAGMPPAQANKQTGGLFNVGGHQVIFNTHIGGNHTDHVHVGLRG